MKYYWINLDNAEDRRKKILKEFKDNGVEHYRVNAYKGGDNKWAREMACVRSHIQAMFHFVMDSNDDFALICEDDLTFDFKPYWKDTVENVFKNAPNDCGVLQLACIFQQPEKRFGPKEKYFRYKDDATSSCMAYVINRKCAQQLLNYYINNKTNIRVADCFQNGIYPNVDKRTDFFSYTYKYPMFVWCDNNDTQIGNSMALHDASKRHIRTYLIRHKDDN